MAGPKPWRCHRGTGPVTHRASLAGALRDLFPVGLTPGVKPVLTRVSRIGWSGAVVAAGPRPSDGVRIVAHDGAELTVADYSRWAAAIKSTALASARPGGRPFLRDDPDNAESWR